MTRLPIFDNPLLLGFDHFEQVVFWTHKPYFFIGQHDNSLLIILGPKFSNKLNVFFAAQSL